MGITEFRMMVITLCSLMQLHSAWATLDGEFESAEVCPLDGPCPRALLQSIRSVGSVARHEPRVEEVSTCVDSDPSCPDWGAQGGCGANWTWMSENCRKSCNACGQAAAATPPQLEEVVTPTEPTSMTNPNGDAATSPQLEEAATPTEPTSMTNPNGDAATAPQLEEAVTPTEPTSMTNPNGDAATAPQLEEAVTPTEPTSMTNPNGDAATPPQLEEAVTPTELANMTTAKVDAAVPPELAVRTEVSTCVDNDPNCPEWGAQGRCGTNFELMSVQCRKSCSVCNQARIAVPNGESCDGGIPSASCSSCKLYYDDRLGYGANSNGWCVYVPAENKCFPALWAANNNMVTQSECETSNIASAVAEPIHGVANESFAEAPAASSVQAVSVTIENEANSSTGDACTDSYSECEEWRSKEGCANNWEWMSQHCMKSCRVCDKDTYLFAGAEDQCALRDGSARCWGKNGKAYRATMPNNTRSFREMSLGQRSVCAILHYSGSVDCWGDAASWNGFRWLANVDKVQVGEHHMCVLQGTKVKCFGDSAAAAPYGSPDIVPDNLPPADQLQCGRWHCCIRTQENKSVQCWGFFNFGAGEWQEGPVELLNGGASSTWSCAIMSSDRRVKCFSFESETSGKGASESVEIQPPTNMSAAEDVCTGYYFGCALLSPTHHTDGKSNVQCWGGNPSNVQVVPISGSVNKLVCGQSQAVAMNGAANSVIFWGRVYENMPDPLFP